MIPSLVSLRSSHGLARELVRATIGSAGVRFAGMGMTFMVGVQLARFLGPDGYGIYGTVMAIVAVLVVCGQLGLPQLITREVSARISQHDFSGAKGALVWFSLSVGVASLVVVLVGFFGFNFWQDGNDTQISSAFYWSLALVPLFAVTNLLASALRGLHKVVLAQVFDAVLRPMIFASLLLAAFSMLGSLTPERALKLHVVAASVIVLVCAIMLFFNLPRRVLSAKTTSHVRNWVASAVPMTGTDIVRTIDGHYAVLLLGFTVATHDVGIFRVALASAAFVALPGSVIAMVILPYIAKFHAMRQTQKIQKLAAVSALAAFSITLIITIVYYIFGQALVKAIFGPSYIASWIILVIISLAYTIQAYFGQSAVILNMSGEERTLTLAFAVALVVAIILSILLIPVYGAIGIAISMVISEAIKGVVMWRRASISLGIDTSVASVFYNLKCRRLC